MKNLSLKIFSLIAAILLAHFVNSEGNSSVIGFFVPVEIKNLPRDKVLLWPLTPQAQVSVKGPSFLVSNVASSPPTFKVKIPSDVQTQYVATLSKTDLALPPNVEVVSVDPNEIKFTFDTLVEKELPVEVTKLGTLSSGLKVDDVSLSPARVRVRGPESRLRDVDSVQTEPIDLREIESSFTKDFPLRPPAALVEVLPQHITISYKVSRVYSQRKFTALPVEIRSVSSLKYTLSPSNVTLEVSGPLDRVSALKAEDLIPFVRVPAGDDIASGQLDVATELPEGISVVQIDPPKVQVVKSTSAAPKRAPTRPKIVPTK
ncbi:MAG: YbbR-like domain-containing protein [Deltaproteobacteria bacterium]|nr:YbbR-like domain-containing protein [Deltaproteobacteria bacterium]